jgi:hypothetical protein
MNQGYATQYEAEQLGSAILASAFPPVISIRTKWLLLERPPMASRWLTRGSRVIKRT